MYSDEIMNKLSKKNGISNLFKRITSFRETTVILIIIIIGFALSFLSKHFFTIDNIISIAIGLAAEGIVVVGMTFALVSGGLDFSVGSVLSLSGVIVGALFVDGMNIWLACIFAIIAGMIFGALNGFFVGKVGLNPFITTVATLGIARGTSYVLTQGSPISLLNVPKSFTFIGQGKLLGIPFIVVIFIVIAVLSDFMMRRSEPLRKVFYIGSNERAAVLSGINTVKTKILVYIFISFLASIAGLLSIARFGVATPAAGLGADVSMKSISAAIIGGVSLSGGEGTIFGAVLGVILLNLINNGLILLNIPIYWQDLINGVILIIAVTIDFASHKKRTRKASVK